MIITNLNTMLLISNTPKVVFIQLNQSLNYAVLYKLRSIFAI